ncbi:hypothetical protein GCM10023142_30120 [Anaerocolumna aminovalerica]|uniref:Transposase n=1 Tax=Anaerocolumna aminovalerica TaxID=1527 RepID=A0A1I5IYR7_9FIRM|nr:hypothetical protein [Anaerocolumna aminovalerica]SFO65667.1 hypothetical protein SAMN04489757_1581 [Anaerocolumna aminovalerica]
MTTQEVKHHYSIQKWTSIIQECITSGLPVRQWCNQNGILEGSYYYWLKKVRLRTLEDFPTVTPEDIHQPVSQNSTVFAKLPIPQKRMPADVILSVNGMEIGFNNTATVELIHAVLSAVNKVC